MRKNQTDLKIDEAIVDRANELVGIKAMIQQKTQELANLTELKLRTMGCLEQLDALKKE